MSDDFIYWNSNVHLRVANEYIFSQGLLFVHRQARTDLKHMTYGYLYSQAGWPTFVQEHDRA